MEAEKIKTIAVLPPNIRKYFDKNLLMNKLNLGDDLLKIYQIYKYISLEAEKYYKFPIEYERWINLQNEFLRLYESTLAKEKKQGTEAKNRTKEPLYFIRMPNKRLERIFFRLRCNTFRTKRN